MAEIKVPVTKGKSSVTINTDNIPEAVFREVVIQGLKVLVNRGMSKVTKEAYPEASELQAKAMEIAAQAVENILAGKVRIVGAKAEGKVSGAVMTEARRLARNIIRDGIKRSGGKVSHIELAEITKAANALIVAQPDIIEQAKASIAERDAKAEAAAGALESIVTAIPISAKKKAKAEADNAEKKTQASAAKAGKVAKRSKPAQVSV